MTLWIPKHATKVLMICMDKNPLAWILNKAVVLMNVLQVSNLKRLRTLYPCSWL